MAFKQTIKTNETREVVTKTAQILDYHKKFPILAAEPDGTNLVLTTHVPMFDSEVTKEAYRIIEEAIEEATEDIQEELIEELRELAINVMNLKAKGVASFDYIDLLGSIEMIPVDPDANPEKIMAEYSPIYNYIVNGIAPKEAVEATVEFEVYSLDEVARFKEVLTKIDSEVKIATSTEDSGSLKGLGSKPITMQAQFPRALTGEEVANLDQLIQENRQKQSGGTPSNLQGKDCSQLDALAGALVAILARK